MANNNDDYRDDAGDADNAPPADTAQAKPAPEPVSLRGQNRKTTRFKPRAIIVLVIGGITLLALAFALALSNAPDSGSKNADTGTQTVSKQADALASLPSGYEDVQHPEPKPESKPKPPKTANANESDTPAAPKRGPKSQEQTRAEKRAQRKREHARGSAIFFASNTDKSAKKAQGGDRGPGSPNPSDYPQLAEAKARAKNTNQGLSGLSAGGSGGSKTPTGALNMQNGKQAFASNVGSSDSPDYLQSAYKPPRSRFEIKAGTTIPAALETKLNSDLPGKVKARVTRDVYDSRTGDYLLIPQGAVLIGKYNSSLSYHQSRAQVGWLRMIMPNGNSIDLKGMSGTDALGVAGITDQVDYHSKQIAGAILLSTAIAAGGNYARGNNTSQFGGQRSTSNVVGDTISQNASQVGQQIVQKELNVQPTIKIRPGYPLRVFVDRDIVLKPYDARN